MKKAFTLIELLVVVLIIGILAAIALPQYQVAVWRSRYKNMVIVAHALADAQKVYFMANNEYTTDKTKLDVNIPDNNTFTCDVTDRFIQCKQKGRQLYYEVWLQINQKKCFTALDDKVANQVCSNESGTKTYTTNSGLNYYTWY